MTDPRVDGRHAVGLILAMLAQAVKDVGRGDADALEWLARVGYDLAGYVYEGGEYVVERFVLRSYGVLFSACVQAVQTP